MRTRSSHVGTSAVAPLEKLAERCRTCNLMLSFRRYNHPLAGICSIRSAAWPKTDSPAAERPPFPTAALIEIPSPRYQIVIRGPVRLTLRQRVTKIPAIMAGQTDELDHVDRALIGYLQAEGRAPLLSLASRLGISHGTVRSRLNRLLRDKVISVVGIVEPKKVGFPMSALIGIRADLKRLEATEEALVRFDELTTVATMTGRYDFFVWGNFRDDSHLLQFLTHQLSKIPGIRATETFHILSMNKRIWQWKIPLGRRGTRPHGPPRRRLR
jgi:Lrp/AsnC family transcriptional regulator, regulator for asnA, asnC and gidA